MLSVTGKQLECVCVCACVRACVRACMCVCDTEKLMTVFCGRILLIFVCCVLSLVFRSIA